MPDDSRQLVPASGRRPTMIKGLVPSLPERGKIKIGMKGQMIRSRKGNDFQPPQKLDHFIVTTLQRGQDGNFIPDDTLMRRLGPKPTEIPVRLLYDDPTLNFPTRYACFIGRSLWCSGDGEVATRLTETPQEMTNEKRVIEPREVQCPCHRADPAYERRDKCKMNGSLSVLIEGAGGIGGVWKFRTTSYNSIVGIMSSMAFLRSVTGGVLANIPLKLRVQPKQATAPSGEQVVVYIVSLEFDGDMGGLQTIAHGIALDRAKTHVSIEHIEDEARRLLALAPPANAPLPGDEPDDVVDEFYPEQAIPETDEPEPPRGASLPDEPDHTDEGPAIPGYTVVDCEGESLDLYSAAEATEAIEVILDEAARRGGGHLAAAIENNAAVIDELNIPLQSYSPAGTSPVPERRHGAAEPVGDNQYPAGGNGNGADQPKDNERARSGGRKDTPPAGDTDLLGDKPTKDYRVRLTDETMAGWDAWHAAMAATIEAAHAADRPLILRQNRENLDIFEQVDAIRSNKLMRAMEADRG